MIRRALKTDNDIYLRGYINSDADEIVSWISNERDLRLWSADRYGNFPIKADDINNNYNRS